LQIAVFRASREKIENGSAAFTRYFALDSTQKYSAVNTLCKKHDVDG